MERGWNAAGLLEALWGRVGGRDRLAELVGIQPATLSGYNTGRLPLGLSNARRIAEALEVSLLELGAPAEEADDRGRGLLDRLEALEAELAAERRRHDRFVRATTARLAALEAAQATPARRSGRQPKGGAAR